MYLESDESEEIKQSSLDFFDTKNESKHREIGKKQRKNDAPSSDSNKPLREIQMPSIQLIDDIEPPKSDFIYHDFKESVFTAKFFKPG